MNSGKGINKEKKKLLPEELLPVLVPPDRVNWLYRAIATVEYRMLPMDPVLWHCHARHHHGGVHHATVQG